VVLVGLGVSVAIMSAADLAIMGAADDEAIAGLGVFVTDPRVGRCYKQLKQEVIDRLQVVPCGQPHDAEVFAIASLRQQELPAQAELQRLGDQRCTAEFRSYVGVTSRESELNIRWSAPTGEEWASGDRTIVCALENPSDRLLGRVSEVGWSSEMLPAWDGEI
jgi:hypothetical protein